MNRNAAYVAVFGVLCVLAGVLVGANIAMKPNLSWQGHPRPECKMGEGSGPIDMLAAKLELNADQKAKVADILEKTRQEIDNAGKDIRGAIAGIKEKSDKQIMDILTPKQQEKFKEMQKEFGERRRPMDEEKPFPDEELPPRD